MKTILAYLVLTLLSYNHKTDEWLFDVPEYVKMIHLCW